MSNSFAVSMQELELESAELLPGRETLCVSSYHGHPSGTFSFASPTIVINVALLNGSLNNLLGLL